MQQIAGHDVLWLDEATSTNEVARARAAAGELRAGDVIVADRQSAGRGRRGRQWVTLPGRSLAASVLLPPLRLPRPSRVTVLGAVAACRALAALGVADVAIKWPNDLMRGERKLGGILVEQASAGEAAGGALVFGIGINLQIQPGDLPDELSAQCCDAGLSPDRATRERLLAALLAELDAAFGELGTARDGGRSDEYRERSWLTGRRVELIAAGRREHARIADVSGDGDLLLDDGRTLAGETVQLVSVDRAAR